jgi:hypothetical protein
MNTSSPSRSLRLALVSVAAFGVGALLGLSAEAQPRAQLRPHVYAPVVIATESPVPPPYCRTFRVWRRPPPVFVRPAPVVVVAPLPVAPLPAPPPPVVQRDAHGVLVTAETRLIAGQALRAQWGAGWFDAQVIAVESGGARIHYTGYGDMWNEVVPLHRLRIAG